jgi:hypothetical protein
MSPAHYRHLGARPIKAASAARRTVSGECGKAPRSTLRVTASEPDAAASSRSTMTPTGAELLADDRVRQAYLGM